MKKIKIEIMNWEESVMTKNVEIDNDKNETDNDQD